MKEIKVVDDYITKIKRELYGIDIKTSEAILEELQSHILEKASDLSKAKGLKRPNKQVYQEVLIALGEPGDVVVNYLKVLPKKHTRGTKLFFTMQLAIGLISIIFGLDQVFYSVDIYTQNYLDDFYFLGMATAGIIFIFIGLILLSIIYFQLTDPKLIIQYGAFASILSLTLAFGTFLIMLDYILWRYTDHEYYMEQFHASIAPVLILLVLAHILGLQHIERLQRRFAIEDISKQEFFTRAKKSKTVMITVALVVIALISMIFFSMVGYDWIVESENDTEEERLFSTEHVGGKYNADLELWYDYHEGRWYDNYKIKYTIAGEDFEGNFDTWHRKSYDWIKNSTEPDSVFLCWWDYGHSIRGYSEREVIIHSPSKGLENTIFDSSTVAYWEVDYEKVKNVARAFITTPSETVQIMKQYNTTYIFSAARDRGDILYAFFVGAEVDMGEYFETTDENYMWKPTTKGRATTIYRMWSGDDIEGLELVYSDINTRIYEIEN